MAHTVLSFSCPLHALPSSLFSPLPSYSSPFVSSSSSSSSSSYSSSSSSFRRHAKFQPFEQGQEESEDQQATSRAQSNGSVFTTIDPREVELIPELSDPYDDTLAEDSVLPDDIEGAVVHSSESTAYYISGGGTRAIVELQLPELENLNEEGAQQKLWDLARLYLESLHGELKTQRLKAIFPDAGAAALLKHLWPDAKFSFGSLNDRKPISDDDDVIILVVPDYQMLSEVQKIASVLAEDTESRPRPLIMWNPRLFSGDVGIGLNVRRFRDRFISTFTVVYHMRPLAEGAIFRRYPGLWQVFLDDKEKPGRYKLAMEQPTRPYPDDLDLLLLDGQNDEENVEPSPFTKAMGVFASLNRFMRSLSK